MDSLGLRLSKLRKEKHKNIKDLAATIGISIQAWTDYEKGRTMPQVSKLMAISRYFDVSTDYLLFGADQASVPSLTPHYDSYILCLIELLSSGLLQRDHDRDTFHQTSFRSNDEIIKIFALEYDRAIEKNSSFLTKDEMKGLLNMLSKRFSGEIVDDSKKNQYKKR